MARPALLALASAACGEEEAEGGEEGGGGLGDELDLEVAGVDLPAAGAEVGVEDEVSGEGVCDEVRVVESGL